MSMLPLLLLAGGKGGGILGKVGGWLGSAGGSIKDWFVGKGKSIWKNTKENPFGDAPGGGESKGKGGANDMIKEIESYLRDFKGGTPGPVSTSQTPGETATGPVAPGSTTSPTPQGGSPTTTAMFQPGGQTTAGALKNLADALGGIPHTTLGTDSQYDTKDPYHQSHQAIDIVAHSNIPGAGSGRNTITPKGLPPGKNNNSKDSAGLLAINKKMAQLYGPGLAELIYAGPGGINIKNGKIVDRGVYGNSVMDQHHDHVHVAATVASLKQAGFDAQGHKTKGQGAPQGGGQPLGGQQASAPTGPVGNISNPTDFAHAVLKAGGWPDTPANVAAIVAWENQEGGNWHNSAKFNPLNTTQSEPGAGNTGSQGNIKVYTSWQQGVQATVETLNNGRYANIVAALKAGNNAQAVVDAVSGSPWGTGHISVGGGGGAAPAPKSPTPAPNVSQQQQQGGTPKAASSATGQGEGFTSSEGNILAQGFTQRREGSGTAPTKQQGAQQGGAPPAPGNLVHATPEAAKAYAQQIAKQRGWNFADWDFVANAESGWQWNAANPSGAYGIPQALPGSKMASAGPDWRDNAGTQINWMADYMDQRWHGAAGAAAQERSNHWYHIGSRDVPRDQLAWLQRGEMVIASNAAQLARDKTANVTGTGKGGDITVILQSGAVQGVQGINSALDAERLGKQVAQEIKNDEQLRALVSH